jgi:NhaA family Na+:H+ antiporter
VVIAKTITIVREYSLLLVSFAALALYLAYRYPTDYARLVGYVIIEDFYVGHPHVVGGVMHYTLTLSYLVNDMAMALFFAVAGKEVWEAVTLKGGALRGAKAATPVLATVGGVLGPIAIYLLSAHLFGSTTFDAIKNGWAIPTATDIAFSYMVGRVVFGAGHPAVKFLLTVAVIDDAVGVIILAIFFPTTELQPAWLLVSVFAGVMVYLTCNRFVGKAKRGVPSSTYASFVARLDWIPFAIAGAVSWYAFAKSGIHPALGLLPIIPAIPHAETDLGLFSERKDGRKDLLNRLEHNLRVPVDISLGLFGLVNAGVQFTATGPATWTVLSGLFIGKPLGIFLFGALAVYALRFQLPAGVRTRDLLPIGMVAGIGFTVSLFVTGVSLPLGEHQDAAKMGALLSLGAVLPALVIARLVGIVKVK